MRKLSFLSLVASLFLFTGCSSDDKGQDTDGLGEEIAVNITAEIPTLLGVKTKSAYALSSINSAKGGVNNVDPMTHDLRYILEIIGPNGTMPRQIQAVAINGVSKASFTAQLVKGVSYKFVLWADFIDKGSDPTIDNHYNTTSLDAIVLKSVNVVNDDSKDAYFVSENKNAAPGISLILKRPLGKVRYIATDYAEFVAVAGNSVAKVTQRYTYGTKQYTTFSAVSGNVDETSVVTPFVSIDNTNIVSDQSNIGSEQTLYWDYLFAPAPAQTFTAPVAFTLNCTTIPSTTIYTSVGTSANALAQRNTLTTIKQSLFTTKSTISVEVDDDFDNTIAIGFGVASIGTTYYATIADAFAAAKAGDIIVVAEGVYAEELNIPPTLTVEGRGDLTVFTGYIKMSQGSTLKNVKSVYAGTERTAIIVNGSDATVDGVVFDTQRKTSDKPEAIVTTSAGTGLKVTNCTFNAPYWKGLYLETTDGVKVTNNTFYKMNPFSTDKYVNTLTVTGNKFIRASLIGDSQMIHFIAPANTDDKNPSTWVAGLEATVTQIKTMNTWTDTSGAAVRNSVKINTTYVHGLSPWTYK